MRSLYPKTLAWTLLELALVACLAAPCLADGPQPSAAPPLVERRDPLSITSSRVTRLAVHAPGQFASEVLAVFKLPIDRFIAAPLEALDLDGEMLRPYLLGGIAQLRLPDGRTVGENLPGAGSASALHIGGGAELRLRDRLFLTLDFGEILHSGPLRRQSYETYMLGLLVDF